MYPWCLSRSCASWSWLGFQHCLLHQQYSEARWVSWPQYAVHQPESTLISWSTIQQNGSDFDKPRHIINYLLHCFLLLSSPVSHRLCILIWGFTTGSIHMSCTLFCLTSLLRFKGSVWIWNTVNILSQSDWHTTWGSIKALNLTHLAKKLATLTRIAGKFTLHRIVTKEGNNKWNNKHTVLEDTVPCPDIRNPCFPAGSQNMSMQDNQTKIFQTT